MNLFVGTLHESILAKKIEGGELRFDTAGPVPVLQERCGKAMEEDMLPRYFLRRGDSRVSEESRFEVSPVGVPKAKGRVKVVSFDSCSTPPIDAGLWLPVVARMENPIESDDIADLARDFFLHLG
jgi:hypothetical protein